MTLLLDLDAQGIAYTCLEADDGGARARVLTGRHPSPEAAVGAEQDALVRAIRRALARPDDPRRHAAIATHGRLLFDLLLPAEIKARLRAARGGALVIATRGLDGVPWQALHDGEQPLGLRWAIGELLLGQVAPGASGDVEPQSARLLVVADPAGDLPAARFEGEALMKALAGDAGLACDLRLGRLRRADLLRIFKSFRMIHFAGHADPPGEEGAAGWRLADGRVDAAAIRALAGGAAPRLVFLNACRSAEATDVLEALIDAGVRHVIGAGVDLPDLPGADFAMRFYAALRAAAPVGEALRLARVQAAEAHDPIWAAYRLLGDPDAIYLRARPIEQHGGGLRRGVVLALRDRPPTGPAEARVEAAQRARDVLRQQIAAHGGRLLPGRGVVARAVFGVPIAHENDLERAVRAALALVGGAPERRITLAAGPVVLQGVDVVGDPVWEAEAACWARPPGVWPDPAVRRALAARADFDADGRLVGLRAGPRRAAHALVGRTAELDQIERQAALGAAVTLIGPAGIGKSHLADAALDRLRDRFEVVQGPPPGYVDAHPFQAIALVIRSLLGVAEPVGRAGLEAALRARIDALDLRRPASDDFLSIDALLSDAPSAAGLAEHLGGLGAALDLPALAAGVDPRAVPQAVRAFVAASARERPLAIAFDGVHALPDAALVVVEELVAEPPEGVFVLTTARPALLERSPRWGSFGAHLRLEIGPLPARAAEAVVRQVLPDADPALIADLTQRAAGNPLFLRELGLARCEGEGELPPTVEAVIQARIDRLAPADQQLLRTAAIFGRVFWAVGLARLLGSAEPVEPRLTQLARRRFVEADGPSEVAETTQWRFAHPLLQEVLLAGMRARERRAGHARAALWLSDEVGARDAHLTRIARHLDAAGDPARAAVVWLEAAERATAALAPIDAAQALEAALAADAAGGAFGPERRAEVEARLADRRAAEGELDAAAALFERALAAGTDPLSRAHWLRRRAEIDESRSDLDAARARLAEARGLLAGRTDPAAARIVVHLDRDLAWLAVRDGDNAGAAAILQAALARTAPDDAASRTPLYVLLGVSAARQGEAEAADRWYRQAVAGAEATGNATSLGAAFLNLGNLAVGQGDHPGAIAWYGRAIRVRARQGDRDGLARAYGNLGTVHAMSGEYDRAARYLNEAIRIRTRMGHVESAVYAANLGEVYLKQGRLEAAAPYLERAIAQCRAKTAPGYLLPDALRGLAELRLAQGDPTAARIAAREALDLAEASGDRANAGAARRVLGEALAQLGAPGALAALDEAIATFEALEHPLELGRAYAAKARHVDPASAAALQSAARRLFASVNAREELARLPAG